MGNSTFLLMIDSLILESIISVASITNCYCCSLVAKSCPTLCDPMDCRLPGSSVHGLSQTRILEWVAISFSGGSFWPRDRTGVSYIGRWFLYHWAIRKAHTYYKLGHLYFPTDSRQKSKASIVSWSCREYEFPSLHKSLNQKGSSPLILSLSLLCTEWLRVLFISAVISLDYMSMKKLLFQSPSLNHTYFLQPYGL